MGRFTLICTVIGAVLCLAHYIWHDSDPMYLLFYMLSVPAWFAPAFINVVTVNIVYVYLLTVLSWAIIGFFIDLFAVQVSRRRAR
ncbi:hypothetical protein [Paenibacillus thalictri]|uniref:Uncharacterized protein n=1 Tax=Paenibacillus thalictri TaxID=2527873 RepID=A0A4Q9DRB4_9BACL|nr:hypothetical protein [Paenibacillus thalictri]TBL77454.1 hypothetical protein EYB31_18475 [Paenibacillus thalictri]